MAGAVLGGLNHFYDLLYRLKDVKRAGWLLHGISRSEVESVSDHQYLMSMIIMTLDIPPEKKTHCVQMALVHDIAEALVGDLTPHDGVAKTEKHRLESAALETMISTLPDDSTKHIRQLWQEYTSQATECATLVKNIDRYEMLMQAFRYEKANPKKPAFLQEFFDSTVHLIDNPLVVPLLDNLMEVRSDLLKETG